MFGAYGSPFASPFGSVNQMNSQDTGLQSGFVEHSTSFARHNPETAQPHGKKTPIDIVFCMDCTSSMSSYIATGKQSITNIAREVAQAEDSHVRFGYVAYRDHPPQDATFVTRCHNFTDDAQAMERIVGQFGAFGGGDGPEAVASGLKEALDFPWRADAVKLVVLIADAPPHGVSPGGDGFPNGEPNGVDPVVVAKQMAERGIVLYVVACEPSLSQYPNAHDVMEGLAQITEGKYLPLTGASLLPAVIIGGAGEEASLKALEDFVRQNVADMKQQGVVDEGEMERRLQERMEACNIKTKQVEVTDIYGGYQRDNIERVYGASSLSDAVGQFQALQQPQMQMQAQSVGFGFGAAPAKKMMQRCMKSGF